MTDSRPPLERLRERVAALGAPLCLGIDPRPDALPEGLPADVRGVESFARGLVEAAAGSAVAVKLNTAYFEAFGSAGWAALERVRADVPPGPLVILDAKRGDIGPSAERYAEALMGRLAADGVTLQPYLGEDAIEPFLAFPGRLVYLLVRTSNPSAGQLQDLLVEGHPLATVVARWADERWPDGRVGLVVGATAPGELRRLREEVPGPAFLVPGVGAQGGELATALACCHGIRAPGVVNLSRAIAERAIGLDWQRAAGEAALGWLDEMRGAGATLGATS
ncbi:MAG TPA: orotidine-5'-phosphate decarboxylase [Pleomorphomonadaceae bacterium]|nr:orotidine-5'-phosphate decarboxylase [Pleomorphomonadaceae bacterium]